MAIIRDKIYGVGIVGEGEYSAGAGKKNKHTIQYSTWLSMLKRCYDEKEHIKHPSYKTCETYEDWKNLQEFSKWFDENYVEGYQLDKDLLVQGNKLYSPATCCFLPQEINLALIKPRTQRELPTGVYRDKKRFTSHIKVNKKSTYLGMFATIEEASNCYKQFKKKQLKELGEKYKNSISEKVYNCLINYTFASQN